MNIPNPADADATHRARITAARMAAWQSLLTEVTELHARVEYLSLLLKLGVRSV